MSIPKSQAGTTERWATADNARHRLTAWASPNKAHDSGARAHTPTTHKGDACQRTGRSHVKETHEVREHDVITVGVRNFLRNDTLGANLTGQVQHPTRMHIAPDQSTRCTERLGDAQYPLISVAGRNWDHWTK